MDTIEAQTNEILLQKNTIEKLKKKLITFREDDLVTIKKLKLELENLIQSSGGKLQRFTDANRKNVESIRMKDL